MSSRPSFDQYFLQIAAVVATRGTCDRLRVGCVLVFDNDVVSTGYNGGAKGLPHCDVNNHGRPAHDTTGSCQWAAHAESNAVTKAARRGHKTDGATAYVTHEPCVACLRLLINAGVAGVVFAAPYKSNGAVAAMAASIDLSLRGWCAACAQPSLEWDAHVAEAWSCRLAGHPRGA